MLVLKGESKQWNTEVFFFFFWFTLSSLLNQFSVSFTLKSIYIKYLNRDCTIKHEWKLGGLENDPQISYINEKCQNFKRMKGYWEQFAEHFSLVEQGQQTIWLIEDTNNWFFKVKLVWDEIRQYVCHVLIFCYWLVFEFSLSIPTKGPTI